MYKDLRNTYLKKLPPKCSLYCKSKSWEPGFLYNLIIQQLKYGKRSKKERFNSKKKSKTWHSKTLRKKRSNYDFSYIKQFN